MVRSNIYSIKRWWWVFLFSAVISIAYQQVVAPKKKALSELSLRIKQMQLEKERAELSREELMLAVASQDDPAWIEMVLMRDLGVVPEKWLKVHFKR